MSTPWIKPLHEIYAEDRAIVGGKAFNLARLVQRQFPVPPGFCITTAAYRACLPSDPSPNETPQPRLSAALAEAILAAYRALGGGRVAVRSSATAEDLAEASFAGQQETFLNVEGDQALVSAVEACWASLWTPRAVAYRQARGIPDEGLAMAVIVQQMVDAEVAGVLFTQAPTGEEALVIEAVWGLGEALVSGHVTPDHYRLHRQTGALLEQRIQEKTIQFTAQGESPVPPAIRHQPTLDSDQLQRLWQLGMEVEAAYGAPQDIEWAYAQGRYYLLQTRPITAIGEAPTTQRLIEAEIRRLRSKAAPEGTVWSRFNLSEVLPAPLPMTWSIVREFMSGQGGFGLTYRDLGFQPHPLVDSEGVLELIAGRVYFDLSREPMLYFNGYLMGHDFAQLKRDPRQAMYPRATTSFKRTDARFWLQFPLYLSRMIRADRRVKRLRKTWDRHLQEQVVPAFLDYVRQERDRRLDKLSPTELHALLQQRIQKVLNDFAREALKASVFAGLSYVNLEMLIERCFGEEHTSLAKSLVVGLEGDMTVETHRALWKVATGEMGLERFLEDYGHRAVNEFELAQPRWREDPRFVQQMVEQFRAHPEANPEERLEQQRAERERAEATLAELPASRLAAGLRMQIQQELEYAQRYMPWRETAKFYLMLGYELIRQVLLEFDRRFGLDGGIFYLHRDELPQLLAGKPLDAVIAARREERERLLEIEVPDVLYSDDLEAIGRPPMLEEGDVLQGLGVSVGVAEGPAVVLDDPAEAGVRSPGYVLVCASTDPGWTPLFLNASALVMERGGMLSHGAVVAREYGLPAVVNVPHAMRRIRSGQRVRVDGSQGWVRVLPEEQT